ncbi:hypothetical protein [Acidiferrobacter sp.]|uniref:hypothetical protein n=1 Tax=Acidiferrobacter sp. TaxID=1872107 RepID=UPI0026167865|nr:hypothetical protein [Acidiferrobacter sp.]
MKRISRFAGAGFALFVRAEPAPLSLKILRPRAQTARELAAALARLADMLQGRKRP